ncbi:hypothetical protein [Weissella cibaria]|nr:hypothetical protein [Weissella cibaria]
MAPEYELWIITALEVLRPAAMERADVTKSAADLAAATAAAEYEL